MSFFNGIFGSSTPQKTDPKEEQTKKAKLESEVNQQLSNWYGNGASKGLDKIAAVLYTILLNPENRKDFFEDMAKGVGKGISGSPNEPVESEESLVKNIFSGLRQLTGSAIGEITGIALRKLLSNANAYGVDEEDKNILDESKQELDAASKPLSSDVQQSLSEKVTSLRQIVKSLEKVNFDYDHNQSREKINNMLLELSKAKIINRQTLFEAGKALSSLLSYLISKGDSKEKESFQVQLETVKKQMKPLRPLYETAQDIRERLGKYHVIVGGFDISILLNWKEDKPSEEIKSINPISELLECQRQISSLTDTYALPLNTSSQISAEVDADSLIRQPSQQEIESAAVEKTNTALNGFCADVSEMCTMKAVDHCFGIKREEAIYKQLLQEKNHVRESYAKCFKGIKKYLIQIPYMMIHSIVAPILSKIFVKLVEDIRAFLKDEVSLLKFAEEKISDLSEYAGSIENLRQKYLDPKSRDDLKGTFLGFCKLKLIQYGDKFTEADLLNLFKEYIVENYTPRPKFTFRIPLLTAFFEWCIFSIRKVVIRSYLKQSQIIETYLKEGTSSIELAQVAFKRLIVKKLNQLKQKMDQNLAKRQVSVEKLEASPTPAKSIALTHDQREKIITKATRKTIDEFSGKLVRFIDIEECNGNDEKLKRLDNKVDTLFHELKEVLQPFLPLETFSLTDTMHEACSSMTENAIVSIFETSGVEVEEQMQACLDLLSDSFKHYEKDEDQKKALIKRSNELKSLNDNLKSLTHTLSQDAVRDAVNNKLENVSGERHKRVVAFVDKEKEQASAWLQKINQKKEAISKIFESQSLTGEERFKSAQLELGAVSEFIDDYLRHLSGMLRSKDLDECYSDVQKELFSTYRNVLVELSSHIIPGIEAIAAENKKIFERDQHSATCTRMIELSQNVNPEANQADRDSAIQELTQLNEAGFGLQEQIGILNQTPGRIDTLAATLKILEEFESKTKELEKTQESFRKTGAIATDLNQLAKLVRQFGNIKKNMTYRTDSQVFDAKEKLKEQIFDLLTKFKTDYGKDALISSLYEAVIKPLIEPEIVSKEALTENRIQELNLKLHSPLFSRKKTLFDTLATAKTQLVMQTFALKAQVSALEASLGGSKDKTQLNEQMRAATEALNKAKEAIAKQLTQLKELNKTNNLQSIQTIGENLNKISTHTQRIFEDSKKPSVKGYITVGELQLKETLSPKIISVVVPQIESKMETAIQALEKPFHWKQLVLRLILTDIANKKSAPKA